MKTKSNFVSEQIERLGGVAIVARSMLMKIWIAGITLNREEAQWLEQVYPNSGDQSPLEITIRLAAFDKNIEEHLIQNTHLSGEARKNFVPMLYSLLVKD